ncbi:MAG: amino acid transporter permease [Planctomycetota bacterium]|nr:amino acid transporter permease [Planctomycetota bacterium]
MIARGILTIVILMLLDAPTGAAEEAVPKVTIGSKSFTESVILGELAAHLTNDAGAHAVHRRQLGGTRVLFNALEAGELDVYPEYSGTIAREILASLNVNSEAEIRAALAARGIVMSRSLGFSNTYAIGMREELAETLKIRKISDLRQHPELALGFSSEFMDREDGWPRLRDRYQLPQRDVRGLDHDLAYRALQRGAIQATDLYSTDAEIRAYKLRVLQDDLGCFPAYDAVWLYRADLPKRAPRAVAALTRLEGHISTPVMIAMNARARLDGVSEDRAAAEFLGRTLAIKTVLKSDGMIQRLARHAGEHLALVAISLTTAIVVALPLGILAANWPRLGQVILAVMGMIQTIPSLALLVFMIPVLGIGSPPAIVALFLYSLLPIVRNTTTGLRDIPSSLRESAEALGLSRWARLRLVELPLASRSILAGIKTAAVIDVGTATLGALIGAGGFGQPILTGIRLADMRLILLEGALPAALLALIVQAVFELAERFLVPRGLRLRSQR